MRKYLAADDRWIAHSYAVHRVPCQFEKHAANPVLRPDRPWEGNDTYCFGSALLDEGRYRLWYQVYCPNRAHREFETAVAYAESSDGIHWTKPDVGKQHPDHGPTNLVWLGLARSHFYSPAVVRNATSDDPERRYVMMYWGAMTEAELALEASPFPVTPSVPGWGGLEGEGAFLAVSSDGITWRKPQATPVFSGACDATSLARLDDGRWLATTKISVRAERHYRVIGESTSADGRTFSPPRVVLEPDWHDATGTEFYGMPAFDYFGNRLGLLWVYHNAPDDKRVDVQLCMWDADTGWQRAPGRHTLLANGGRGAWDAGAIYTASAPLISPPQDPAALWLYYGGFNVRHDDDRYRRACIGLARLPLDRFAALQGGHFRGSLRSRPLLLEGPTMTVNADTRDGELQVRILSADGKTVLAESAVQSGIDGVALDLTWAAEAPPIETSVIVEFLLLRARLYAFGCRA